MRYILVRGIVWSIRREGVMKEFRNKVAVVTGAASGMGKAIAERFAAEGMRLALADVEHDALAVVEREFRTRGDSVLAVPTDVSKAADVERLAARTVEAFGMAISESRSNALPSVL
jgi:NAD(P)-dependent dehydrogenase (short-subunit alcohol dehydrogenase family)